MATVLPAYPSRPADTIQTFAHQTQRAWRPGTINLHVYATKDTQAMDPTANQHQNTRRISCWWIKEWPRWGYHSRQPKEIQEARSTLRTRRWRSRWTSTVWTGRLTRAISLVQSLFMLRINCEESSTSEKSQFSSTKNIAKLGNFVQTRFIFQVIE